MIRPAVRPAIRSVSVRSPVLSPTGVLAPLLAPTNLQGVFVPEGS